MIINVRISIQKISNFNKIYFSASKPKNTTLLALQEKSLHVDQNILILYQIYGRVKFKNLWTLSPVIPRKCTNKKDWHYKFERHRLFNQKFTTKITISLLIINIKQGETFIKQKIVHVRNIVSLCFTIISICIFFFAHSPPLNLVLCCSLKFIFMDCKIVLNFRAIFRYFCHDSSLCSFIHLYSSLILLVCHSLIPRYEVMHMFLHGPQSRIRSVEQETLVNFRIQQNIFG